MERGQYEAWSTLLVLLLYSACSQACIPPTGIPNGVAYDLFTGTSDVDTFTLTCFPGFKIVAPGAVGSNTVTDVVSTQSINCGPDTPGDPTDVTCECAVANGATGVNGAVTAVAAAGTYTYTYKCNPGYISPSGVADPVTFTVPCSEPPPDCYCNPPMFANGYVASYPSATQFTTACNTGYEIVAGGAATQICSATPAACVSVLTCTLPTGGIANGVVYDFVDGSPGKYTVACFPGFEITSVAHPLIAPSGVTHMQVNCPGGGTTDAPAQADAKCVCARAAGDTGTNGFVGTVTGTTHLYTCNAGFISPSGVANPTAFTVDCGEPLPACYCNPPMFANGYVMNYEQVTGDPGFRIACNNGYEVTGTNPSPCASNTPPTCEDINECTAPSHDCAVGFMCGNVDGGFYCYPTSTNSLDCGFPGDQRNAYYDEVDFDLATAGAAATTVTCEDGWTIAAGAATSYTIKCLGADWVKTPSGASCTTDIDECATAGICGLNAHCRNTPGFYSCECDDGYYWETNACKESRCVEPGLYRNAWMEPIPLVNTKSGQTWTVTCEPGWQVTATESQYDITCTNTGSILTWDDGGNGCLADIDECATAGICGANAQCTNKPGSYSCDCDDGYYWENNVCKESRCVEPGVYLHASMEPIPLVNTKSGQTWIMKCDPGWQVTATESQYDITCTNTGGILQWDDGGKACLADIDECATTVICGANTHCRNTLGSYSCECDDGYYWENNGCKESRCVEPGVYLHASMEPIPLVNTKSGQTWIMKCEPGWQVTATESQYDITCTNTGGILTWDDGGKGCLADIDECTTADICGANAHCTNNLGSYSCDCDDGYYLENNICKESRCVEPGVYPNTRMEPIPLAMTKSGQTWIMKCVPGWQVAATESQYDITCIDTGGILQWEDGGKACLDIDECKQTPAVCGDAMHTCVNKPGTFHCSCAFGYRLDSAGQCVKIPLVSTTDPPVVGCELIERMGFCRADTCTTSPAGFPYCTCPEGDGGPFCAREEERSPMLGTILGVVANSLVFILFIIVMMMCLMQVRPSGQGYGKQQVIAPPPTYSPLRGFRIPWRKGYY